MVFSLQKHHTHVLLKTLENRPECLLES